MLEIRNGIIINISVTSEEILELSAFQKLMVIGTSMYEEHPNDNFRKIYLRQLNDFTTVKMKITLTVLLEAFTTTLNSLFLKGVAV